MKQPPDTGGALDPISGVRILRRRLAIFLSGFAVVAPRPVEKARSCAVRFASRSRSVWRCMNGANRPLFFGFAYRYVPATVTGRTATRTRVRFEGGLKPAVGLSGAPARRFLGGMPRNGNLGDGAVVQVISFTLPCVVAMRYSRQYRRTGRAQKSPFEEGRESAPFLRRVICRRGFDRRRCRKPVRAGPRTRAPGGPNPPGGSCPSSQRSA